MSSESKAAHTPGPWFVGGLGGGRPRIIYAKSTNQAVANAVTFHGKDDAERMEANARLIALSPAMLEVCEAIADLDWYHGLELTAENSEKLDAAMEAARKIIASITSGDDQAGR